ncbi:HNH endonuclease [Brevibacterium renqingii]|uniref:HNH endonuclease n=1 Tax=Brevibacterium renqingii TaxID=2776916 RepID=UPI001AE00E42|nr:DUF222 domain-containing protein [Brevibacterium renqingii]
MEAEQVPDVLTEIHRWRRSLSELPPAKTEEEAIDRIAALEELNSASAAAQARETLTFDMLRRNREAEDGVASEKQGRGLGAEIALARRVSRSRGDGLLKFSRTLLMDLPRTYAAMKSGDISEEKARVVVRESDWLPREKKHELDERMAERLPEAGVKRLGNEVRALAQQLDQRAAVKHLERRVEERSVSVRPAPGNMAYLTALLPMPQAVAAFANLQKSAQSLIATGESSGRTQSQIAVDLLVERLTGQASAAAVPTEVHLIMQASSLFEPGAESAWFPGCGPIPAQAARDFVTENEAAVFVRRMYTRPEDGQLVRMDSRRREFSGLLRRMVVFRDDVCRSPWCEAPIKHADHADSYASGGTTGWVNSSGLCAACNFAKELSGWRHEATPDELEVITPTGHHYRSRTKPISGPDPALVRGEVVTEANAPPSIQDGRGSPGADPPGAAPSNTGPPGADASPPGADPSHTDQPGADASPPGADPSINVLIPWRFRPRDSQPSMIDIGGKTIGVEVFEADDDPLSPAEELLCIGTWEHRRQR